FNDIHATLPVTSSEAVPSLSTIPFNHSFLPTASSTAPRKLSDVAGNVIIQFFIVAIMGYCNSVAYVQCTAEEDLSFVVSLLFLMSNLYFLITKDLSFVIFISLLLYVPDCH